jgi:hypothetical protein
MDYPTLRLEKWVAERLQVLSDQNPRYEASWYGPHNALLNHFFPRERKFLVKCQPKLRPVYETRTNELSEEKQAVDRLRSATLNLPETEQDNDEASDNDTDEYIEDNSLSSTGGPVLPRITPGREVDLFVPDFVVAKATRTARADTHLLIVEIKVEDTADNFHIAREQVNAYLDRHLQMDQGCQSIDGMIVCGGSIEVYTLNRQGPSALTGGPWRITGRAVRGFLLRIAKQNWFMAEADADLEEEDGENEDHGPKV